MENELFDDLLQSLNEAVDYAKGDKTQSKALQHLYRRFKSGWCL